VGGFDQIFTQMIQYVYDPNGSYYDNLTQARSKGWESELHAILWPGFTASANYTHTIARVYKVPVGYAGTQPGTELLRRPSHSGHLNLSYIYPGRGSVAITTSYIGKRPDTDFNQFPSPTLALPSVVRVDLGGSVDVLRTLGYSVAATAR